MPSDQEKNAAADSAQPILVVEQQMSNRGDAEPRYDPKNRIGSGRAKPGEGRKAIHRRGADTRKMRETG